MGLDPRARQWLSDLQLLLCMQVPTWLAIEYSRLFRRKKRESVQSILVIRVDGLGDCVLTLPLLHQLRGCYPAARIMVVTRPSTAEAFRLCGDADEVLTFGGLPDSGKARLLQTLVTAVAFFWQALRGRRFDVALSPRWDIDVSMATFLCALTRAAVTVGYEDATTPVRRRDNRGFQRAFTTVLPRGPVQHEVLRNLELARAIGCRLPMTRARMTVGARELEEARRRLSEGERGLRIVLGLPAGSAKRRWPAERYLAVLEELQATGPVIPVIFVDAATAETGDEILRRFPESKLMAGLTLSEATAIFSISDIFLGSDSGLAHVAAATGCVTATLSPHPQNGDRDHTNSPERFHPYGIAYAVFQPRVGRQGCVQGCECDEAHCILDIDSHEVVLGIRRLCLTKPFESKYDRGVTNKTF